MLCALLTACAGAEGDSIATKSEFVLPEEPIEVDVEGHHLRLRLERLSPALLQAHPVRFCELMRLDPSGIESDADRERCRNDGDYRRKVVDEKLGENEDTRRRYKVYELSLVLTLVEACGSGSREDSAGNPMALLLAEDGASNALFGDEPGAKPQELNDEVYMFRLAVTEALQSRGVGQWLFSMGLANIRAQQNLLGKPFTMYSDDVFLPRDNPALLDPALHIFDEIAADAILYAWREGPNGEDLFERQAGPNDDANRRRILAQDGVGGLNITYYGRIDEALARLKGKLRYPVNE